MEVSAPQHSTSGQMQRIAKEDLCVVTPIAPQPPLTDPVWQGNSDGAIYVRSCPMTKDRLPALNVYWAPGPTANALVTIDPIVLAEQAKNALRLPKPNLARSPAGSAWVNEYTWVWLESAWKQKSTTARAGTAWATVTARPRDMQIFAARQHVTCSSSGRPWTPADGGRKPTDGGCGLMFTKSGTRINLNVTVPYDVTWVGAGGAGGDLGVMTTTADQQVTVLEAAAVGRS